MLRVSAGTAAVLGLNNNKPAVAPTTAYFMQGEHCLMNCAFCTQARSSRAREDFLSRVTWPQFAGEAVLPRLSRASRAGSFRRACIQVVRTENYKEETRRAVAMLRSAADLPLCLSINLAAPEEALEVAGWGVEIIGLPLDAATPGLYREIKGGSWEHSLALLAESARLLPGRTGTHLIIGLGESEEEAVRLLAHLVSLGVRTGLFAFTPVRGTALAGRAQPAPDSYRRIQAAHYLLRTGRVRPEQLSFRGGRLIDFGLPAGELAAELASGEAFRTSGCPDCNRPFYNERPGGVIYNYPRPLTPDEAERENAMLLRTLG
ncbi:radical SAM protein [Desulfotomaculum copahuensis]|nr:radical SAM protein [Desulfotomaculum copahuensis]